MARPRAIFALVFAALGCPGAHRTVVPSKPVALAPSPATLRVLGTLKKNLRIQLFASVGFDAIDAFLPPLESLLSTYRTQGGGRVQLEIVRPERLDLEGRRRAEAEALTHGVRRGPIREPSELGGAPFAATDGLLGLSLTYGAEQVVLTQDDGLDARFAEAFDTRLRMAMRELIARDERVPLRIGLLYGLGQGGLETLAAIEREHPHLRLERIDPGDGEHAIDPADPVSPIDPTLRGLLVVQSRAPLSKRMLRRIDQVLMSGRTVSVFASGVAVSESDPKLSATLSWMGLDDLLARYGVRTRKTLVVDRKQFWVPQLDAPSFTLQLDPYPFVWVAPRKGERRTYDDRFPPLFAVPELVVPLPTELSLETRTDGATAREVVWTLPSILTVGVSGSADPIALLPRSDLLGSGPSVLVRKEEARRAVLGVVVEGSIRSAFAGEDPEMAATAKPGARLFVLSTGALLGNFFAQAALAQSVPEDDPLRQYALLYQRLRAPLARVVKQTCEWMADTP